MGDSCWSYFFSTVNSTQCKIAWKFVSRPKKKEKAEHGNSLRPDELSRCDNQKLFQSPATEPFIDVALSAMSMFFYVQFVYF